MINKAILMGRLTRDPELRHTGTGTPVCSFSIAIDNGYGENRQTDFINCVAWNKTAEFVTNYFSKGKMIIVIGRISTRSWEGQDGKKNYTTEVIANEVQPRRRRFLSSTVLGRRFIFRIRADTCRTADAC